MKEPTKSEIDQLIVILKGRFEKNINRHPTIDWNQVLLRIESNAQILRSLYAMESTGGEPDVIEIEKTILYSIFLKKAPLAEEVYVMTEKVKNQEKNLLPKVMRSKWQQKWELNF